MATGGVFAETTCQCSLFGSISFLLVSYHFRFCWIQRSMIAYASLVGFCIDFQKRVGFGELLTEARVTMLLAGIVLFCIFFERKAWRTCGRKNRLEAR